MKSNNKLFCVLHVKIPFSSMFLQHWLCGSPVEPPYHFENLFETVLDVYISTFILKRGLQLTFNVLSFRQVWEFTAIFR